jgi:2-keto-4-pentenoate hydratase/2-oxohepta-3-ene-1,7-dioic acid hydratase in catechol pathway
MKGTAMRLVTYALSDGGQAPGVERSDGSVLAVTAVLGEAAPPTVARLLGVLPSVQNQLSEALHSADADPEAAIRSGRVIASDAVKLKAPLGERILVVCAGGNYRQHIEEMGDEEPSGELAWFVKSPNAIIGSDEDIHIPASAPDQVDFEGELCIVIGRPCHAVSIEDAMSYIGGYTLMNDVSARDAAHQVLGATSALEGRSSWMNMLLGKQFPTFAPIGPAVVTPDEIGDPASLQLVTKVNGTVMQDANTSDLVNDIPTLVARLSEFFNFEPGDVISTGSPAGVGFGRKPPVFLRSGDTVSVDVKGIGALVNRIK